MCRARALSRTRGDAHVIASGKAFADPNVRIVKLVRRHEVADRPKTLQFVRQSIVEPDRRVQEEMRRVPDARQSFAW